MIRLVFAVVLAWVCVGWPIGANAVVEGQKFPDVRIAGMTKGQIAPKTLVGKVTIINFWATWCEACKVELKEMQADFAELLKDPRFQFAFVSLDKDPQKAVTWVENNLKDPKVYLSYLFKDPEFQVADELDIDSFPMTLVIDATGKVVKIQRGFKEGEGSTKALASLAGSLLK